MTARITQEELQFILRGAQADDAPKPKKKRRKKSTPESLVVNALIRWLWANGCFVYRNNTGALQDKNGRWIRYGYIGSADILGLTATGRYLAVEAKGPGGKLRDEQKLFRDRVQEKGGIYILAYGVEDLEARKKEITG